MSVDNNEEVVSEVRAAAIQESGLRERVRVIVMKALVDREADPAAIREVMSATVSGVGEGLAARGAQAGGALRQALQGMDEAVGRSVYSVGMALEEVWGQGRQFAESDIKQTLESVRGLEQDLLTTLKDAADKSQGWLKSELGDVAGHLQRTGTDTGIQVKAVLDTLNNRLKATAAGSGKDVRAAAELSRERLSAVASGILRGLADALDTKSR